VIGLQISNALKIGVILLLLAGMSAAKTRTSKHSPHTSAAASSRTAHKTSVSSKHRTRRGAWKRHGQQEIRDDRAAEIQQALIREKYLDGTPSGQWDTRTQQAMARYQADHGWQSKVTPDSRAIIKLGLGPNHAQDMRPTGFAANAAAATASATPGVAGGNRYKR
jgi:peptidoglycan hydrolase-like protein with peptidoglycan-binding domain